MAVAALTPRVRLATIRDRIRESVPELGVYHLRGVRQKMKKKPAKKMVGPTLQEFELIPVTDPAELAELDRRCRLAEKGKASAVKASKGKSSQRQ